MKNRFFKFVLITLLVGMVAIAFNKYNFNGNKKDKVSVKKWDNFYQGNNIHFYYQDNDDMNIQQVEHTLKLKELVKTEKDDFEKAIKLMKWLGKKLTYNQNSMNSEGYAIEVIKNAKDGEKTVNDEDYCSVYMELATSAGLNVRKGEFRAKEANKEREKYNHFICEVWSDKYNKWIMLDPSNGHYITYNEKPISALEALQKGTDSMKILGENNSKKYIKKMKKYFYSYTIPIDNTIYGTRKSNSFITYTKHGQLPEIFINNSLVQPTIFTNKDDLFKISPKINYNEIKEKNVDDMATLIFSQKKSNSDKEEDIIQLYGGVFKDSVMEEKYYISINNGEWKEINKYFEYALKHGENIIRLSIDKKNVQREVCISYRENEK